VSVCSARAKRLDNRKFVVDTGLAVKKTHFISYFYVLRLRGIEKVLWSRRASDSRRNCVPRSVNLIGRVWQSSTPRSPTAAATRSSHATSSERRRSSSLWSSTVSSGCLPGMEFDVRCFLSHRHVLFPLISTGILEPWLSEDAGGFQHRNMLLCIHIYVDFDFIAGSLYDEAVCCVTLHLNYCWYCWRAYLSNFNAKFNAINS